MKLIVIGASKGIGIGTAKKAFELNYEIVCFAKNKPEIDFSHEYHYLDIDSRDNLSEFEIKLKKFSNVKAHYLVCTGGGLSSKNEDFSINTLQKVWWHNCGFPLHVLLQLRNQVIQPSLISLIFFKCVY